MLNISFPKICFSVFGGAGYWGEKIVSTISKNTGLILKSICDPELKDGVKAEDIWFDKSIDAVAICTPPITHFELAYAALLHGKHVLVEKPITLSSSDSNHLFNLAEKNKKVLMMDSTFLFNPAISHVKKIVQNEIGDVIFFDSERTAFGKYQNDINCVDDLVPHDFSIINYIFSENLRLGCNVIDFVKVIWNLDHTVCLEVKGKGNGFKNIFYSVPLNGLIKLGWMYPEKTRRLTVVGDRGIVEWNNDNVIFYKDKNISDFDKKIMHNLGQKISIPVDYSKDALTVMLGHFVECINGERECLAGRSVCLSTVRFLEACRESIKTEKEVKL